MIFVTTYKNDIEAVFFHIWDAQRYINTFSEEEQKQMEILRIHTNELKHLKTTLQKIPKLDTNIHSCKTCSHNIWDNNILICNYTKEEVTPNDHCIHYL